MFKYYIQEGVKSRLKVQSKTNIFSHTKWGKNKMSSYIGIGFISKWTTKNIFISNVLKAFDNEISLLGFANPIDILNQCFDNYEKEFCFDIKIDEYEFTNIILQIEKIENDCICL
jgi:hypothetical protein